MCIRDSYWGQKWLYEWAKQTFGFGSVGLFCSMQYHFRVKLRDRRSACGFEEARNDRMDETGKTRQEHAGTEVGRLKPML